ncbi:carboxymuconolactone decarboxylase family protein [Leifsonia sp. SIMBA_070]|uniref:carboxymuconolactone decarboxylase family protein n=1 Tax=Leifsonia sp. SIMBA_070 TaxID=3085810 RepID=UPI003979BD88
MRLAEIDRGDTLRHRMLIGMISRVSGMRLPDAARVAFYHHDFAGPALGAWVQKTMRGPSPWTISERELMAATVARWNACPFCVGAHSAVAVRGIDRAVTEAVLLDYRSAPISTRFRAALTFIEKMTLTPNLLTADDARAAFTDGLTVDELRDAAAVAAVFNVITRYANALEFAIPPDAEFDKAAGMLLRRGYS